MSHMKRVPIKMRKPTKILKALWAKLWHPSMTLKQHYVGIVIRDYAAKQGWEVVFYPEQGGDVRAEINTD